ncbi:MAG: hypothetical protein U9R44_07610 [Candidatus Omnitrophota bacterium]|nr:hypothetical protein [Candidatus Omnitrophota bacterium]
MEKKKYVPPVIYRLNGVSREEAQAFNCKSGSNAGQLCDVGAIAGGQCSSGRTATLGCSIGNVAGGTDVCKSGSMATNRCRTGGVAKDQCKDGAFFVK